MSPTELVSLFKQAHWLPIAMMLTLYARKLCSPDSGFPVSIPPRWLPSVTALGGLLYGFLSQISGGGTISEAAIAAVSTGAAGGFFDGLLTAIFNHDDAPKWARTLVWIVDDVAHGGAQPPKISGRAIGPTGPTATPPPAGPPVLGVMGLGVVVAATATIRCANLPPPPPPVVDDFQHAVACVEANITSWQAILANCSRWTIAEIESVIRWLLASSQVSEAEKVHLRAHLAEIHAQKPPQ